MKTIQETVSEEVWKALNRSKEKTGMTTAEVVEEAIFMYEAAVHDGIYEVNGETFHTVEEYVKREQDLKTVYDFVELERSDHMDTMLMQIVEAGRRGRWNDQQLQEELMKFADDIRESRGLSDEDVEGMIEKE